MAFVHHESNECSKSELDLFTIPSTQTSISKGQWIEYHPLSNITETGPIKFNVSGSGEEYLDLARTQLYVKAKTGADLGGGCRGCAPPPPGVNLYSSYSLLKFVYLTSQ